MVCLVLMPCCAVSTSIEFSIKTCCPITFAVSQAFAWFIVSECLVLIRRHFVRLLLRSSVVKSALTCLLILLITEQYMCFHEE